MPACEDSLRLCFNAIAREPENLKVSKHEFRDLLLKSKSFVSDSINPFHKCRQLNIGVKGESLQPTTSVNQPIAFFLIGLDGRSC